MHAAPSDGDERGSVKGAAEAVPNTPADGSAAEGPVGRRRDFLLGAIAAGSMLLPAGGAAQTTRRARRRTSTADPFPTVVPLENKAAPLNWSSPVIRLVRRATMGVTAEEVLRAQMMGYQAWLNRQVNYTQIADHFVTSFVASKWPLLSQTPEQLSPVQLGTLINQLSEGTLYRAAFSNRQLYERMVEFWSDHFNIAIDKVGYLKLIDDREVIRKHAMGRFHDLVMASARSPAMLAYLDQNLSRAGSPNENYARELLELHTVGVDGGYTQQDVVELSRVLTGWTLTGAGNFRFDPSRHDWGSKTVMGMNIPAGSPALGTLGVREGEQVIAMLTSHPSTARFIATKMLRWLLTPNPTETQIRSIASVFRSTGGEIRLMVRAILNSQWLVSAPVKLKRPFHLLASALRATNPSVSGMNTMRTQLTAMGHAPFDWETPDGYPDNIEYWAGNVITRWAFATALSTSNNATISIDIARFTGTTAVVVDAINEHLFAGELHVSTRTALFNYLSGGTLTDARRREALALAMSCAEFQWY